LKPGEANLVHVHRGCRRIGRGNGAASFLEIRTLEAGCGCGVAAAEFGGPRDSCLQADARCWAHQLRRFADALEPPRRLCKTQRSMADMGSISAQWCCSGAVLAGRGAWLLCIESCSVWGCRTRCLQLLQLLGMRPPAVGLRGLSATTPRCRCTPR